MKLLILQSLVLLGMMIALIKLILWIRRQNKEYAEQYTRTMVDYEDLPKIPGKFVRNDGPNWQTGRLYGTPAPFTQVPISPKIGEKYYNATLCELRVYTKDGWVPVEKPQFPKSMTIKG